MVVSLSWILDGMGMVQQLLEPHPWELVALLWGMVRLQQQQLQFQVDWDPQLRSQGLLGFPTNK